MSASLALMEPCRFDTGCWRPLCPYGHSGRGRAARWAALWSLLALQEKEDDLEAVKVIPERFVEQNADVLVPPVVAEVEIIPKEHISERKFVDDVPVPLIKERISERTAEQTVDVPTPQILEEIVEAELSQCVDSGLACLVRGVVELVWHPLLFGFFQAKHW